MAAYKKILIVDDNRGLVNIIDFELRKEGFEVFTAYNGEDGLKKALDHKPDLIIMDIQLPGIDGHEATRRIRKVEEDENLPIIALTSFAMPVDRELALAAGCDGYITKPIDVKSFIDEINRFLAEMPTEAVKGETAEKD